MPEMKIWATFFSGPVGLTILFLGVSLLSEEPWPWYAIVSPFWLPMALFLAFLAVGITLYTGLIMAVSCVGCIVKLGGRLCRRNGSR